MATPYIPLEAEEQRLADVIPISALRAAKAEAQSTATQPSITYVSNMASQTFVTSIGGDVSARERPRIIMDDKDVRRLEDRIAASEKQSQLRLEVVVERIEGAVTRIADQVGAIKQEMQEQRTDSRALRSEVSQVTASVRAEISGQLENHKATERAHFHWIMGTIVAVGLAGAALVASVNQIWGSGVQVGQSTERNIQELLHGMQTTLRDIQEHQRVTPPPSAPSSPQSPAGIGPKTQP